MIPLISTSIHVLYICTVEPLNVEPMNLTYFTLDVQQLQMQNIPHSKKGVNIAMIYDLCLN
jgi:hypothetical protein